MMTIISRTKGDNSGIWAEILSSHSGATGEYNSECRIYQGKRMIGYLEEDNMNPTILYISGTFDYRETGEVSEKFGCNDIPIVLDERLMLSTEDLVIIKKIMEYWESEGEEYADMWRKSER